MAWTIDDIYDEIAGQFGGILGGVDEERTNGGLSTLLAPVDPYNRSPLLASLVTAVGAVSLLVLSGLAVGTFAVTLASLLAIYFLLTEVFGYELSLAPFPA